MAAHCCCSDSRFWLQLSRITFSVILVATSSRRARSTTPSRSDDKVESNLCQSMHVHVCESHLEILDKDTFP